MSFQTPKYQPLYLIQRLHMRNKDNQIPFAHRFEIEYMGSSQFERGEMGKRIRELNEHCHVGEIMVNGMFMLAAWNPNLFTLREAEREINRVYRNEQRTIDPTDFNDVKRKSRKEREAAGQKVTNAWFDIANGLFWTWERVNISDIRKNFRLQVELMDGVYTPKPVPPKPVHPLRQRLIDEDHLRPSKPSSEEMRLYDRMLESRSAARSLDPEDEPLSEAEYERRRQQLHDTSNELLAQRWNQNNNPAKDN